MSAVPSDRRPQPRPGSSADADGAARAAVEAADGGIEAGRGRSAGQPSHITRRGWRDIAVRLWRNITTDNLGLIAAGTAFYMLLALFPALAALVSIYGLVADRASVEGLLELTRPVLPPEANRLLQDELVSLVQAPSGGLSLTVVVSFLFTLWSAHNGAAALLTAVNVAYKEQEKRSFLVVTAIALAFTIGGILFIIAALVLVAVVPAVIDLVPISAVWRDWLSLVRWPLLALMVMAGLAALYRYGPSRDEPRWRWVTWGAVAATVLWILMSLGFSAYVRQFASYDRTYGSLGAVVVLLMWFYLSAYIVLLGAEVNAEMERQTACDTTEGQPEPLGRRAAVVADQVGSPAGESK